MCSAEGSPAGLAARLTRFDFPTVSQPLLGLEGPQGTGPTFPLPPSPAVVLVTLLKRHLLSCLWDGADSVSGRVAPCCSAVSCAAWAARPESARGRDTSQTHLETEGLGQESCHRVTATAKGQLGLDGL